MALIDHARYEALARMRKDSELKEADRLGKIRKLKTLFASDVAVTANKRWAERSFLLSHAVTCPSHSPLSRSLSLTLLCLEPLDIFYTYTSPSQVNPLTWPNTAPASPRRAMEEAVTLACVLRGLIRKSQPPQEHPDILTKSPSLTRPNTARGAPPRHGRGRTLARVLRGLIRKFQPPEEQANVVITRPLLTRPNTTRVLVYPGRRSPRRLLNPAHA